MKNINANKVTKTIIFLCTLLLIVLAFVLIQNNKKDMASLTIIRQKADSVIDPDNPREVVGFADYYFVAKVIKTVKTDYRNSVVVETSTGRKEISIPYTIYEMSVVKNIKGALPTDHDIQVTKAGGLMKDNSAILLFEDDLMPEYDKTYIIAASVQPNGEILISGSNALQEVPGLDQSSNTEDLFGIYTAFYEEEVYFQRARYTSKYD